MSYKSCLALTLFLILSTSPAFAQGEFLDREQSCVELMPVLTLGENAGGYGFALGYCANGYLGIGFTYAKNDDIDAESYGPVLSGHLLKNNYGNGMFGASVYLGFERAKLNIDDSTSVHNTLILGGAGVYYNWYLADWLTIQPSFVSSVTLDLETSWEENPGSIADKMDFYQSFGLGVELYRDKTYRPYLTGAITIPSESSESIHGTVGFGIMAVFE